MHQALEERIERVLNARAPQRVTIRGARAAAVLIPIVSAVPAGEPGLIFTLRTETVGSHKGQISFPGGSLDPGETAIEAALRESQEEIGLRRKDVRVLGELDATPTFVSGFVVTPVVGWIERPATLTPNPSEVAAVIEVPLGALAGSAHLEPGFEHAGRSYPTEAWIYDGHVIWGVTARLLRLLLDRLADGGIVERPAPERPYLVSRPEVAET